MKKIGIFCSACEGIPPRFFDRTRELGAWMGTQGMTLVYGGADMGLMECIARAVKEHGGTVIGVVPTKLEERGRVSDLPDVTIRTDNLSERKDTLVRESDLLVALPGGVGTLDEVFHTVAAATIGYHDKHVVLYNIDGFWDSLLTVIDQMQQLGFMRRPPEQTMTVANTFEEMKKALSL